MNEVQDVFSQIYRSGSWQSSSRSGPGSEPAKTKQYRGIIESVLRSRQISSVVDIGCGDWAFSKLVDWGDVEYTGVDVVPELVAHLNSQFGTNQRRFIVANLIENELPAADLCIVKDVLQHLSNAAVHRFLREQLPRFRYALITNDARLIRLTHLLRPWKIQPANLDIANGDARALRLTRPPFNLQAKRLAWYRVYYGQFLFEKEVLLWDRSESQS